MTSISLPSPQIVLGVRFPTGKSPVEPRSMRAYISKESGILEQGSKQEEEMIPNDEKVWTSSETVLKLQRHDQKYPSPPLVSALKAVAKENAASFHFPGHNRGQAAPSSLTQLIGLRPFLHDISTVPELDNLFTPGGPILEAQKMAAKVFGASETWFLVGGTTCGIQAAIMAACTPGDTLILPRNAHYSAISAMILSGVVPKYIFPDYDSEWDIATAISPSQVETAIKELESEGRKPAAVFITSPTYHGICSNLKEISRLCHSKNIPLIVDEAHGAHFGFHPQLPISALEQGADLAVQSTHKVLCSLTQSSMLHLSGEIISREKVSRCLQTLQSTSPNYLLLASLDAATAQLKENPETVFNNAIRLATEAKNTIRKIPGISVLDSSVLDSPVIDPMRVTVGVFELGLSGYEVDDFLYDDQRVIPELIGSRSITFPFSPGTCKEHVQRLVLGLEHLSSSSSFFPYKGNKERVIRCVELKPFNDINMQLTPREAFFVKKRRVDVKESLGKICGELICPYPPGIPVMIPGEIVSERALDILLQAKASGARVSGASDLSLKTIVICDV